MGVWGVTASDEIWKFEAGKNTWAQIPGCLKQISVGGSEVWGTNANMQIWKSTGPEDVWTPIPGSLTQVSVSNNDHVWGVNNKGGIYRWTGYSWQQIDGRMYGHQYQVRLPKFL